jgi:hypothetical protein
MNRTVFYLRSALAALVLVLVIGSVASASAVLFGDYYRLGDNDPGATVGQLGNAATVDSGAWGLDLKRTNWPQYSGDVSPFAVGSKLSMQFINLPGTKSIYGSPSYYGRTGSSVALQASYGLEAWVKTSTLEPVDPSGYAVIVATDGFGLYQHKGDYVARVGTFEKVIGAASAKEWTHVAYVRMYDQEEFFLNGVSVGQGKSGTALATESKAFMIGAGLFGDTPDMLFNGLVDETRMFTYNPLSMGAFGPGDFLISVPEPMGMGMMGVCALLMVRRRSR